MKERGAVELIEEATLLVREAGFATAGLYYIGALPFVLALLFFWSDMSSDAFAHQRVVPASFTLALLLVWMNVWQAMYAAALYARAAGRPQDPVTIGRLARAAALHAAVQPTALLLLPIGALLAIPFAWIYGFYQNFTALAGGRDLRLWPLVAQSRAYAQLWTRQSWLALAIQAGFTLIVALNLGVALYMGPALLQSFLGIETAFTRSSNA